MTSAPLQLNVVIIGAGLAGLITAWTLRASGHNVKVLEKSSALCVGGADIQISPNAVRCLDRIGLLEQLKHVANPISTLEIRNWHSMDVLTRGILNPRRDYGSMMIRRDDLIQLLYKSVVENGVEVVFDTQVVELNETIPSVVAKNGEKFFADLIIGADGVRSTMRDLIFPDRDTKPIITDTACFQSCIPYNILKKDPETLAIWNNHEGSAIQLGDGKYITSWRNDHRQTFFIIFSQRHYEKPLSIDDWTRKADIDEIAQLYTDYPSAIQKLIRNMDTCEKWRIFDAVEGADWISSSGKVVLIGDAIHAMPPHAAQGLSQGIEDATSLNVFLNHLRDKKHLLQFVTAWAKLRGPRATKIQDVARANLNGYTLPDGPMQQARDEAFRRPVSDEAETIFWNEPLPQNPTITQSQRDLVRWVYVYDVIEEAERIAGSFNLAL